MRFRACRYLLGDPCRVKSELPHVRCSVARACSRFEWSDLDWPQFAPATRVTGSLASAAAIARAAHRQPGESLFVLLPNSRRVGAWYMVTPREEGAEVVRRKEMVDKAEPKVRLCHSVGSCGGS